MHTIRAEYTQCLKKLPKIFHMCTINAPFAPRGRFCSGRRHHAFMMYYL